MPLLSTNLSHASATITDFGQDAVLEAWAKRRVALGESESFLLIVPNLIAKRRLEREFIESARGQSVAKLNILTLADLAGELASAGFPDLAPISDAESAVLIDLSVRELLRKRELSFFEHGSGEISEDGWSENSPSFPIPRGTFELVVNTIRQLKESGVTAADIAGDIDQVLRTKGETTETRRATDIQRIYSEYQSRLEERFMDTYGQTLLVNVRYSENRDGAANAWQDFRIAFPSVTDVFVSGFYYLEPPSILLISRLAAVKGVSWHIEIEESFANHDLFGGLFELESRLLDVGFQRFQINAASNVAEDHAGHSLRKPLGNYLFNSRETVAEPSKVPGARLHSAFDAISEVEEIARRIKLIYESDQSTREDLSLIVIATPSVEEYTPIFQEVFRRHEIPVQIADRYHLDRSPLVQSLIALLELTRPLINKRMLARAIGSPYFAFDFTDETKFNPKNLLDVVSRYRPSGNIAALQKTLSGQLRKIGVEKMESEDSAEFDRLEAEEHRVNRAISDLNRLEDLLHPLKSNLTPTEFCETLRSLIYKLKLPERILSQSEITIASDTVELDSRAYRALMKLLEELELLFHLMGIDNQKMPLAFYEQRLKPALILSRFSPRPQSQAVLVTSLAQSISQQADYLFLAGLVEGAFPVPYQPQVFLTDARQRGERKQLLEERVLFYRAATNFKRQLYLSYPKHTLAGAARNASSFLDALSEIIEIENTPKLEGIFSYRDLYFADIPAGSQLLEELMAARPNETHLRTLIEQVPIAREMQRLRSAEEDTLYRGVIDLTMLTDDERAALEYNKSRIWSVTQLELYAKCPFRFFAREILSLGDERELEDGLDARDRGSILHEVLREFLHSRRERKELPQDIGDQNLDAAYNEVRAIASEHLQTISSEHPFWRLDSERLLADDRPEQSVLRRFIKREHELAPFEPRPRFFEVSFGGSGRAPKTPIDAELSQDAPIETGGFKLRGKIDRIDAGEGTFTVIDYKSGSNTASWPEIQRGLSLQLPLYLRVAEDLLRSHIPQLKGVAALYHKLLEPDSKRKLGIALKSYAGIAFEKIKGRNGYIESEEDLVKLIDSSVKKAKTYVDGVSAGNFRLTEADLTKQCETCPYGSVCRVREAEELGVLR